MKYQLCTYDVWGNQDGGYEVNNVYGSDTHLELTGNESDGDILTVLAEVTGSNCENVSIDGNGDEYMIELEDKNTGKPLGRLQLIEEN